MNRKGLTLTEIMVSVSIIGLIATIAIPAVTNLRETAYENICRKNLQAIDNAKLQWAVTEEEPDDAEPTEEDMAGYIRGDFPQPVIAGALYDINDVVTPALCSFHGNGVVDGLGMGFPSDIADLVKSGDLDASDVIGGDWNWTSAPIPLGVGFGPGGDFMAYDVPSESGRYGTKVYVGKHEINPDVYAEVNINGNTIKGFTIVHHSEEYIEYNRESFQEKEKKWAGYDLGYEYSTMLKMDKGGYKVCNYDNQNKVVFSYYDHEGNLIGTR